MFYSSIPNLVPLFPFCTPTLLLHIFPFFAPILLLHVSVMVGEKLDRVRDEAPDQIPTDRPNSLGRLREMDQCLLPEEAFHSQVRVVYKSNLCQVQHYLCSTICVAPSVRLHNLVAWCVFYNTIGLVLIVRIYYLLIESFYCVRNYWKHNHILFIVYLTSLVRSKRNQ